MPKRGRGRRQRPCGAKYAHKKHKVEKYKKQKTKKQGRNFIAGAATRRHTQQINNNNYSKKSNSKKSLWIFCAGAWKMQKIL